MNQTSATFTGEEREFLVGLLRAVLKDTLIEEHRTRTLSFREHVVHKEEMIREILTKLAGPEKAADSA